MILTLKLIISLIFYTEIVSAVVVKENCTQLNEISLVAFNKYVLPVSYSKHKGEAGRIAIIGGSIEYTGAPFFAAITALKVGADLVYVITTESAAPVIKSYSPDLIVYPFLSSLYCTRIDLILAKVDVVVIGPGLGKTNETISLTREIIESCRLKGKPLVIDADGLSALEKDVNILKDYPKPGAILTPNRIEAERLKYAINSSDWTNYWGAYVSVLVKGKVDKYYSRLSATNWEISEGGSRRRAGGQGDILAGSLGTFYHWALNADFCRDNRKIQYAQSLATYAAAKFTRKCNSEAFMKYGISMTASDMLHEIHNGLQYIVAMSVIESIAPEN